MLLQLEQECLDVYRRKVDQASRSRALLLQKLADSKSEFARLLSALGEKTFVGIVSSLLFSFSINAELTWMRYDFILWEAMLFGLLSCYKRNTTAHYRISVPDVLVK